MAIMCITCFFRCLSIIVNNCIFSVYWSFLCAIYCRSLHIDFFYIPCISLTILLLTASARRWPCLESSIFGTVPRFFGKLLAKVFMHLFNDTVAWGYWLTGCQEEFVVVVSPNFLSSTSNTFAASLRASLSYWSLQVICANIN